MDTLKVKEGSLVRKITIEAEADNIFDARDRAEAKAQEMGLTGQTGYWNGEKYIIQGDLNVENK